MTAKTKTGKKMRETTKTLTNSIEDAKVKFGSGA